MTSACLHSSYQWKCDFKIWKCRHRMKSTAMTETTRTKQHLLIEITTQGTPNRLKTFTDTSPQKWVFTHYNRPASVVFSPTKLSGTDTVICPQSPPATHIWLKLVSNSHSITSISLLENFFMNLERISEWSKILTMIAFLKASN